MRIFCKKIYWKNFNSKNERESWNLRTLSISFQGSTYEWEIENRVFLLCVKKSKTDDELSFFTFVSSF